MIEDDERLVRRLQDASAIGEVHLARPRPCKRCGDVAIGEAIVLVDSHPLGLGERLVYLHAACLAALRVLGALDRLGGARP